MNIIKDSFSIKDLENLSGIKAHTIRIWEKRYNLLTPDRTDTNIRTYSIKSLQKLLNISLLYENGYKISKSRNSKRSKYQFLLEKLRVIRIKTIMPLVHLNFPCSIMTKSSSIIPTTHF